ncbi:MAG: tetratricopeptide repeat protein [Pseudomonadales bacterium]|jgi:tetratricopeptide (TPR) repeat protein|nr:tetratricopeptide repeat protein [Pseudomonadales bacterium]
MKHLLSLLALCCLSGVLHADQNAPELADLFTALQNTRDPITAAPIEARIWNLWVQHDDPAAARLMAQGLAQESSGALEAAVATFSQLIAQEPDFAEAWNRRATLHYLLGNYAASKADIDQVLKLEPYHFGALSGLGLVHVALGEYFQARSAFNAALEVNPSMEAVRANLRELDRVLEGQAI